MQALHFSFGLGAFFAPLIARPFLLEHPEEEGMKEWKNDIDSYQTSYVKNDSLNGNNYNITTTTMMNSIMSSIPTIEGMDSSSAAISNGSTSISGKEKINYTPEDVRLIYTYGIIGICMAINSILFMYLYINHRETAPHPSRVLVPETREGTTSGTSIKNTTSNHYMEGSNGEQKSSTSSRVTYSKSDSGVGMDLPPSYCEIKLDGNDFESINTTQSINGRVKVPSSASSHVEEENETTDGEKNEMKERKNGRIRLLVTILTTFFMHFYCGLEITFGSFLTTFAVHSDLKLSKATGALLTSCFWATFTFFRLFAVFYIDFTGPELNLIFELVLILIANVFLMGWGNSALWGLWTGTALLGLGTSSIWASVFGYIEPYIPVTSGMTASFITAACLGEFIIPAIISSFVETEPRVFLWVTLYCSIAITLLFAVVTTICRVYFKKVNVS